MDLPRLEDLKFEAKKVIVRADLDVDRNDLDNNLRLKAVLDTLRFLLGKAKKVILIGHKGRPGGKEDKNLSLEFLAGYLSRIFSTDVSFVQYHYLSQLYDGTLETSETKVILVENFRFWPEEEENSDDFSRSFTKAADCYVNEAFAVSHREHSSIVGIPKYMPHAAGLRFIAEVENLAKISAGDKKPVTIVLGGAKEDKLKYLEDFKRIADKVLVGGRLPLFLPENYDDSKVLVARLNQDKEDITLKSIELFEQEIDRAGTIVLAGPMGKYEDQGQRLGTQRVFEKVANSSSFKVVGGGDSDKAVRLLGLQDKFDWISVGGGAALEFLAKGTLPGVEALKKLISL